VIQQGTPKAMKTQTARQKPVFKEYRIEEIVLLPMDLKEVIESNRVVRVNRTVEKMDLSIVYEQYKGDQDIQLPSQKVSLGANVSPEMALCCRRNRAGEKRVMCILVEIGTFTTRNASPLTTKLLSMKKTQLPTP
jgi:hypothetical protein